MRSRSRRATSRRPWRGRATSSTSADPKLKWVIPETGGIIWTDNMLIPLGGSVPTASTYMNFVYEPEIAAQLALGADYISSVKGVKEEAAKLNPKAAREHARLPHRRHALADAPERPGDVHQPGLRGAVAGGPGHVARRRWARSSTGTGARRRTSCSRPGSLWLAIFFLIPLAFLGYESLQSGSSRTSSSPGSSRTSRTGSATTTSSSCGRSSTPESRRSRASFSPTRSSTGSPSGPGRGAISSCSSSSRRSSSRTSCGRSPG